MTTVDSPSWTIASDQNGDSADSAEALERLSAMYGRNLHHSPGRYPDRHIIAWTTEALLDLIFPEHRIGSFASNQEVTTAIRKTGGQVFALLAGQVRIAERHRIAQDQASETGIPPPSPEQTVLRLFDAITMRIRERVAEDMRAAYQGDPAARGTHEVVIAYPTYVAVGTYRLAHELHANGLPLIPRMMTEYAHRITGIDIHPGATIGRSFFIDHGTGVVIGETAEIGDRVRLYQGVTLGAYAFQKDGEGNVIRGRKRHPTVRDDATIFANATVLGGETVIGERSIIGSNVWLAHSVEPDSVVTLGEPNLRIRAKNGDVHIASTNR